jgi:chromosome segregation ATPase
MVTQGEVQTEQQDTLPGGQSPEPGKETPGESTPKTYSKEEYDKLVNEKKAADGRHKQATADISALQEDNKKLKDKVTALEESMLDKNDPNAKTNFQLKNRISELEDENTSLKRQVQELEGIKGEYEGVKQKQTAAQVAEGVLKKWDVTLTAEQLAARTDGTKADMEALCKQIGKPRDPNANEKPDLNETSGGGTKTRQQSLEDRYPSMKKK